MSGNDRRPITTIMRTSSFFMLATALSLTQLAQPAMAQSLGDAVAQAWARHPLADPTISAAREDAARASGELASSSIAGPATLSVSTLNDQFNENRGKREWEAELAVPLWLPGQKSARRAEASSLQNEVAARRAALRLQLAGEVRDAWWTLAAARTAHELATRRTATARKLEADVVRRFNVGELARIDANLAQNERLSSEAELADSAAAVQQAAQIYRNLTGVAALAATTTPTTSAVLNSEILASEELSAGHPKLVAATAAQQLARDRLHLATQTRREAPQLAVRIVRERANFAQSPFNTVGVKLTIPLSSSPRVRQDNAAARAELAQADAELALAKMALALEREKTLRDRDTSERQLQIARQRQELSADNLRLAEKSFALGESDLPALLRVRAAAFESEALLHRQLNAVAASVSRINQMLGVLP